MIGLGMRVPIDLDDPCGVHRPRVSNQAADRVLAPDHEAEAAPLDGVPIPRLRRGGQMDGKASDFPTAGACGRPMRA